MISLILTILFSTSIALILKHNAVKIGNPVVLLTSNYFVAALISLLFFCVDNDASWSISSLWFGAILAGTFVLAFFSFAKAIDVANTALASVSARLSVIVPVAFSIMIFQEKPKPAQLAGFVFAVITILMFYFSLKQFAVVKLKPSRYGYLIAVLLGIGINDFCMKIFQVWRDDTEKPFFLLTIFSFSFLYTAAYLIIKKINIKKSTVIWGAILGVPNIFSSFFLISALGSLPAIIVYPMINIGIILLTAFLASLIWADKLNLPARLALFFGIVAIILLSG
ncbi:MAG: EamA family transporter [bacterium]|nr:EamA family transporter [bacterium]